MRSAAYTPPTRRLLRTSRDLQAQLSTLAEQERRLPGGATDRQLRSLAMPAFAFAEHVPKLTHALEASIRDALANGLMLVPSAADRTNRTLLAWVTTTMNPPDQQPPAVHELALELTRAADHVTPGVQSAREHLQHAAHVPDPIRQAAAAARSHAGAARAQLRTALGELSNQPLPHRTALPAHPRMTSNSSRSHR